MTEKCGRPTCDTDAQWVCDGAYQPRHAPAIPYRLVFCDPCFQRDYGPDFVDPRYRRKGSA